MTQEQIAALIAKSLGRHYGTPSVVEGPMGLRMPESLARTVERLGKGLPKECTYRRVAKAASEFRLEDGERSDVSFITTDACDRDREVVLPKGVKMKDYNSVVTFAHRYDQLPVGSCKWIKSQETKKGAGLVAKTQYPTKPADWGESPWMPSAILHLMQQEIPVCTGKSIGFIPLEYREPTKKELEQRPEWDGAMVIPSCVLLEYAVAPVPCNQEAEMETVSKATGDPAIAELIMATMKQLTPGEPLSPDSAPPKISLDGYMTAETCVAAVKEESDSFRKQLIGKIRLAVRSEVVAAVQRLLGVV